MRGKFTMLLVGVLLAELAIVGVLSWRHHASRAELQLDIVKRQETNHVRIEQEFIGSEFRTIAAELDFLTHIVEHALSRGGLRHHALENHFRAFAESTDLYDQVRFLGADGMELIRVNRTGPERAEIVPREQLQDKSLRYYFRDSIALEPGEVFVSPLDLNIERGEIERPLKPVIRFGRAVFGPEGRVEGVVLLNFLASSMLAEAQRFMRSGPGSFMLLNDDGYWLAGPDRIKKWGFMFAGRKEVVFQAEHPEAWAAISGRQAGQIRTGSGLFTFATVRPMRMGMVSSTGSGEAYAPSLGTVGAQEYAWKIVSFVDAASLAALSQKLQIEYIVIGLVIFLLAAGVTCLVAYGYFIRDVHAHRLSEARQAAEIANQAKTDFLANMSHELRTPLNGVLGFLDLLRTTELNEEQRDYVETARTSSRGLRSIIDDLLDLSRIERGAFQLSEGPFSPGRLVESVVHFFSPEAAAKGLELKAYVGSAVPSMVVGDDVRVGQILSNLVGNAIKFTGSGEVCVELRAIGMDRKERRLIEIHVIDTGPGIPEGRVASCFERFTRLDDSTGTKGGAGLGLGIVRQLVELMEGRITVDSEEGRGSTFRVVLPLAEHAGDAAEECLHEEGAGQGERRILLVEDERVNRMLATRMLEKLGYEVVCAVNGQEALDQLTDSDYDAVLMDVKMPVMDGLEATRRIRMLESNGRHRPIIALTAYAFAEDVERCREAGMDDLLAKPFELDDLREALSRTLGGS